MANKLPLIVNATRGEAVESSHLVHGIALDADGKTINEWGNTNRLIHPRSTIKPFQAIAFLQSGAVEKFNLGDKEIALSCASHNAEPMHIEIVDDWLEKIGLTADALQCGHHLPACGEDKTRVVRENITLDGRYNNCSGKHMGMLSACKALGYDLQTYTERDHPHQKNIFKILSEFTDHDVQVGYYGTDGCSVPNPAIPLNKMALAFSRLVNPQNAYSEFTKPILAAMAKHPYLIAGNDQLDSIITDVSNGRIITKKGAEGIMWAYLADQDITIFLKTEDGDTPDRRACGTAFGALLEKYAAPDTKITNAIKAYTAPDLCNWKGKIIGKTYVDGL